MKLQTLDGIVNSIKDIRPVFASLTDREFAAWYSQRYKITQARVLFILEQLKGEAHDQNSL